MSYVAFRSVSQIGSLRAWGVAVWPWANCNKCNTLETVPSLSLTAVMLQIPRGGHGHRSKWSEWSLHDYFNFNSPQRNACMVW